MRHRLPIALTTLRLLLGPAALLCALAGVPRIAYLPILIVGTLSDILDGILARRLGVATLELRRYDSVTDGVYYLFLLATLWILCRPVVIRNVGAILLLLVSEVAVIAISLGRFGKYPATHSYLAKFYGLCICVSLVALLVYDASSWAIVSLVVVAVVTNVEIIAIHLLVDSAPVDVRSVFAVSKRKA